MKKLTLAVIFLMLATSFTLILFAQDSTKSEPKYKMEDGIISPKTTQTVFTDSLTTYQYQEKDALVPVYKTAKGKYYISKISKKTGNYYRKYLVFE